AKGTISSYCVCDCRRELVFRSQAVIRGINPESLLGKKCCVGTMGGCRAGEITAAVQVEQHTGIRPRFRSHPLPRNTSQGCRGELNARRGLELGVTAHGGAGLKNVLGPR